MSVDLGVDPPQETSEKSQPEVASVRVARARWSQVIRAQLDQASSMLEGVADVLCLLVQVVGWLCLLDVFINIFINFLLHAHLSPSHLVVPGVGSLAVLPGVIMPVLIKLRRRRQQPIDTTAQEQSPQ